MSDKTLQVDNEVHELKLGSSFDPKSKVGFHSIRYDFKPASVDTTKDSTVEVGEGHQITVTVPHVEGAGTDHTVYKGNKRPCLKECVLIIDHQTGTFTLEKLTNNIHLKKTRIEGSSKAAMGGRPLTPVDINKQKNSPVKPKNPPSHVSPPPPQTHSPSVTPVNVPQEEPSKDDGGLFGDISDDSSSYDSSSDSESEAENKQDKSSQEKVPQGNSIFKALPQPPHKPANNRPHFASTLSEDLRLSESSSDSDDE